MTDNPKRRAVAALRSGDKATARRLLMAHLNNHPQDDQAWLILSAAVESEQRRLECLQTALDINPDNQTARKQLERLTLSQAASGRATSGEVRSPAAPGEDDRATPSRDPSPSPETQRRIPAWLLPVAGVLVLVMTCGICFAAVGFSAWLSDDEDPGVASVGEVEVATRTIPATNTPGKPGAQAGSDRCAAAEDYLDEIRDELFEFAEIGKLSQDADTNIELLIYADGLLQKYEEFVAIPVPDCAEAGADDLRLGMEAIFRTVVEFAIEEIDHVEATERVREGAGQMLRGLNTLYALAGEQPVPAPTIESGFAEAIPELPATSTPRPRPTTRPVSTPEPLPAGSALVVDDSLTSWEVTVANVDYRSEMNLVIDGDLMQQNIAEHRYVVLFLNAVNTGRQTDYFFPYGLVVRDGLGREYDHDEIATEIAKAFVYELDEFSNEAHPGEVAQTIAVFDLPFDAGPFTLQNDWDILSDETHPGVLLNIQD